MIRPPSHPILSCAEAQALEARVLSGDEAAEWRAMQAAGRAIAAGILRDAEEGGGVPAEARLLVLAGKGHNGGDALIAARTLLEARPAARADVWFLFGEPQLRPLAARAWRELVATGGERVRAVAGWARDDVAAEYDVSVDGIFGFQFRPPADQKIAAAIARANALRVGFRAAVDLPSAGLFRADFTYATGSVKTPLLDAPEAGRVRYLDLGFFVDERNGESETGAADRVLRAGALQPLTGLRPAAGDKRAYGHLFVIGGSRSYPGAVMMNVLGALRSGAGLVTAFVPESLAPAFAAHTPEAMWVGCPEAPDGGLGLDTLRAVRERLSRATALAIGSGLAREAETLALVEEILKLAAPRPVLLDGDALQPAMLRAARSPLVLTPHAGEFARIAGEGTALREFAQRTKATVVLKGAVTRVCAGSEVYHSFFGGPVLARGGSGDVLAGLCGGLLAQTPEEPLLAATRSVVWHGLAADALARARGQVAARTTELIARLPEVLREQSWRSL